MRKVINASFDTVSVPSARGEASCDFPARDRVLAVHATARIQTFRSAKRIVRDRTDRDPPGLVPYVFLSGECSTQEEAWRQAAEYLFP
jgi:hypothetical protein